jgi:hypothetical protein
VLKETKTVDMKIRSLLRSLELVIAFIKLRRFIFVVFAVFSLLLFWNEFCLCCILFHTNHTHTHTHTHTPHKHSTQAQALLMLQTPYGQFLFHRSGPNGLRRWIQDNPTKVNDFDDWGRRPLHVAAGMDDDACTLRILIDEYGANVNAEKRDCSTTPLHYATNSAAVDLLLRRGADPTLTISDEFSSRQGFTPLHVYIENGHWWCVDRYLKEPRARDAVDVSSKDGGETALHILCRLKSTRCDLGIREPTRCLVIQLLLKAGADPTRKDHRGNTPADLLHQELPRSRQSLRLLRQAMYDKENSLFLIKARRFSIAAKGRSFGWIARREARGEALPCISLADRKRCRPGTRNVRDLVAFMVGVDGTSGQVMPSGVFVTVMEFLGRST